MPRTIETTVYQFDELTDEAKEKAREWMRRRISEDTPDTDSVIDDALTCLALAGFVFTASDVSYSGFWSQGDGASFTGWWRAENVKPVRAMRAHAPKDETLRALARDANVIKRKARRSWAELSRRSHHYVHEHTIEVRAEDCNDDTAKLIAELARDAMRWIYKQLEADYDWRNADEQIDEDIRTNEYEFTAEGRRA